MGFRGCIQWIVLRSGNALVSGWFQTIPRSRSRHKYLHKTASSRYGTPYEQDQEHRPSVSSHQLYSLDTVFGQQGAEAQDGCSTILRCTSRRGPTVPLPCKRGVRPSRESRRRCLPRRVWSRTGGAGGGVASTVPATTAAATASRLQALVAPARRLLWFMRPPPSSER